MRSKTARGKSGYLLYPAAYAELVSRGLVLSHERVGLFVAPQVSSTSPVAEFSVPVPALKGVPQVVRSVPSANSSDAIYLSSMYFDPELLPREKLLSCYRSVLARPGLSSASDLQGYCIAIVVSLLTAC